MNCDQAFQHLTSHQPAFSSGELERHLAGCPSCRDMADLFRPITEVLGGRASDEDWAEAPDSWQRVWDAVSIAERAAAQLKDKPAVERADRSRSRSMIRSAALLLVGVFLGSVATWAGVLSNPAVARDRSLGSAPSPSLFAGKEECRCAKFLVAHRHAAEAGVCPTCRGRVTTKMSIAAICVACHDTPVSSPTHHSLQEDTEPAESSWYKGKLHQPQFDPLEEWINSPQRASTKAG